MTLRQDKWADMTALNTMPPVAVEIEAQQKKIGNGEPCHHSFAQPFRAHRIFRAGHHFHRARRQRNPSDRIRRQLHYRLSRRNRRDSRNRSEGPKLAGSNSKDTILPPFPCLSSKGNHLRLQANEIIEYYEENYNQKFSKFRFLLLVLL